MMTNTILAEFVIVVMVIFELVTVCRRGKTQGGFVVMVFLWRILGIVPRPVPNNTQRPWFRLVMAGPNRGPP